MKEIEITHNILFDTSDLVAEVGNNIHYARGPVTSTWPQVIFFSVAERSSYLVDYDKATVQISVWSQDKYQALRLHGIIKKKFKEFRGVVNTHLGNVEVNWTQMIDSSSLPQDDQTLFGHQSRFEIRSRGKNLGGI